MHIVCVRARALVCIRCARIRRRGFVIVVFAGGIHDGVIMTAISFAPLSSKCGDSAIRDAECPRRLEGSLGRRRSAAGAATARVLLRFHPTILAAVAVFLINMLILQERPGTNYERGFPRVPSTAPAPPAAPPMSAPTSSRMFQGLRPRVIRNTCDQGSIGLCKVDSSLRSHTSQTRDVYLEENVIST